MAAEPTATERSHSAMAMEPAARPRSQATEPSRVNASRVVSSAHGSCKFQVLFCSVHHILPSLLLGGASNLMLPKWRTSALQALRGLPKALAACSKCSKRAPCGKRLKRPCGESASFRRLEFQLFAWPPENATPTERYARGTVEPDELSPRHVSVSRTFQCHQRLS